MSDTINHDPGMRREILAMLRLATPLLVAQLAQMGTGVVDTIMAGRYSSIDLAAIAIGYNIWLPIYLVSLGILLAATSIVAHHFGAGRIEELRRCLPQAVWLSLVLGLMSVPLCYFPGPILDQLSLDAITHDKAEAYLQACAFGLPGAALFQALRCHTQGIGIIKPFAVASVIGFLANVPLNYAFIYGHWGVPEMGAAGCGWATAISMWLSPVLITFYALRSGPLRQYMPELRWHAPHWRGINEILSLGLPIGITFFFEVAVFSVIALMIASLGNAAIGAHQIAMNVYELLYVPLIGVGSAITTRMGHAIGAGRMAAARQSYICGLLLSLILCAAVAPVLVFFPDPIAQIYTEDSQIRALSVTLLRLASVFIFIDLFAVASSSALRAFKDTRFPLFAMGIAYWLVALPLGYWLGLTRIDGAYHGTVGFWIGMIAGIGVAALLATWRLAIWLCRPLPGQTTGDCTPGSADPA